MNYPDFFEFLTGFPPYPWQERVEADLTAGKSVVLRAPTGAGKTWGAVAPFLHGMKTGKPLADRLLYALPLRSLASSLHATVLGKMRSVFDSVGTTGKDRAYNGASLNCSLQIGGQKNDPFFESNLVFTTIDQLLSGYIFLPVSLPDRLGNVNAGALIGSLLVFDELHLLDPDVALGTTIEMLDRLHGLCQFVLMTATMSDDAINWLAGKLHASVAQIPDTEIRSLPTERTKRRTWRYTRDTITAAAIRSAHDGGRTIVLTNSVRRAQNLFLELEAAYGRVADPPELVLLHARYYPEDREAIESRLDRYFGPKASLANVILVTTQVVEAGMDMSADQLHTEIAPMNALIQRAGRTARYESRNLGSVTIYEARTLNPYGKQAEAVAETRRQLNELPPEGRVIDFAEERVWVQAVHACQESQQLRSYSNLFPRRRSVIEAMDQGHRGKLTELVRDISSVGVLIAANPEDVDFGGRAWPRLLGVSGISLMALSEHLGDLRASQWVAKGAEEQGGEGQRLSLKWRVLSARDLMAQWLVALHPDFASYHPRLGLVLDHPGPAPPIQTSEPAPILRYQYEFEPWNLHAKRIAHQANVMQKACGHGTDVLARRYKVSAELIEELVEVVCILHDTGKLAGEWQKRAWRRQNDKDARMRAAGHRVPSRPDVPLAHTWFDTLADREWQRKPEYALPHHAIEGAYSVAAGLQAELSEIGGEEWGDIAAACGYTSIARHHGPRSTEFKPFQLSPEAQKTIAECLPFRWRALLLNSCSSLTAACQFSGNLLAFSREEDETAWPLYVFLVRRLRLADQASLRQGEEMTPL